MRIVLKNSDLFVRWMVAGIVVVLFCTLVSLLFSLLQKEDLFLLWGFLGLSCSFCCIGRFLLVRRLWFACLFGFVEIGLMLFLLDRAWLYIVFDACLTICCTVFVIVLLRRGESYE